METKDIIELSKKLYIEIEENGIICKKVREMIKEKIAENNVDLNV